MATCWICGAEADSAEHMVKASDFRAMLPHVSQEAPAYRHSREKRNEPVKGANATILKFKPSLCSYCNNTRTQPHDRAWSKLTEGIRHARPPIRAGHRLPLKVIFGASFKDSMLAVHLYFTKQLGCYAVEYGVPVNVLALAHSIMSGTAEPNLRLVFVRIPKGSMRAVIQTSHIEAANVDGRTVAARWWYIVGELGVLAVYKEPQAAHIGMSVRRGWHPTDVSPAILLR